MNPKVVAMTNCTNARDFMSDADMCAHPRTSCSSSGSDMYAGSSYSHKRDCNSPDFHPSYLHHSNNRLGDSCHSDEDIGCRMAASRRYRFVNTMRRISGSFRGHSKNQAMQGTISFSQPSSSPLHRPSSHKRKSSSAVPAKADLVEMKKIRNHKSCVDLPGLLGLLPHSSPPNLGTSLQSVNGSGAGSRPTIDSVLPARIKDCYSTSPSCNDLCCRMPDSWSPSSGYVMRQQHAPQTALCQHMHDQAAQLTRDQKQQSQLVASLRCDLLELRQEVRDLISLVRETPNPPSMEFKPGVATYAARDSSKEESTKAIIARVPAQCVEQWTEAHPPNTGDVAAEEALWLQGTFEGNDPVNGSGERLMSEELAYKPMSPTVTTLADDKYEIDWEHD